MYDKFQPWVLNTYGDSAKTKTITMKKAERIVKLLQSKDKVSSDGPEYLSVISKILRKFQKLYSVY